MSWSLVTNEWRLKLLALGLGVLMLGAVAFSQNPPTTGNLTLPLSYTVPPNIILINPPTKTNVTYSGLADVIKNVNPSNLFASVDATRALPGAAVRLNIAAKSTDQRVQVQNPPPIVVQVDTRQVRELTVQVLGRRARIRARSTSTGLSAGRRTWSRRRACRSRSTRARWTPRTSRSR